MKLVVNAAVAFDVTPSKAKPGKLYLTADGRILLAVTTQIASTPPGFVVLGTSDYLQALYVPGSAFADYPRTMLRQIDGKLEVSI